MARIASAWALACALLFACALGAAHAHEADPGHANLACTGCTQGDRDGDGLLPEAPKVLEPLFVRHASYEAVPQGRWPLRPRPPYEGRAPPPFRC
ncbi:MAG: hypothetical protein ACFB6R_17595 [Alphaproteobacteria bacterium]